MKLKNKTSLQIRAGFFWSVLIMYTWLLRVSQSEFLADPRGKYADFSPERKIALTLIVPFLVILPLLCAMGIVAVCLHLLFRIEKRPLAMIFRSFAKEESFLIHYALAHRLSRFGSVITVERLEDRLDRYHIDEPPMLLARSEVWQEQVLEIIPRLQYAIIDASYYSEGLQWEIEHLSATIASDRIIVICSAESADRTGALSLVNPQAPLHAALVARYHGLGDRAFFKAVEDFFLAQKLSPPLRFRLHWLKAMMLDVVFFRASVTGLLSSGYNQITLMSRPDARGGETGKLRLYFRRMSLLSRFPFMLFVRMTIYNLCSESGKKKWEARWDRYYNVYDELYAPQSVEKTWQSSSVGLLMVLYGLLAVLSFFLAFGLPLINWLVWISLSCLIDYRYWSRLWDHDQNLIPLPGLAKKRPCTRPQKFFGWFVVPALNSWLYLFVLAAVFSPLFAPLYVWHWLDMSRIGYPVTMKRKVYLMTIGLLWYPTQFVNYLHDRRLWLRYGFDGFYARE